MALLFAARAAEAGSDAKGRDQALVRMDQQDKSKHSLRMLGPTLRGWLDASRAPESAVIEAALKGLEPGVRADAEFCVGWYLDNRGLGDRAALHWKRCAETEAGSLWVKTHARASLLVSGAVKKP